MKYVFRNNGFWLELVTPQGETFWMPQGADVRAYLAKGFLVKEEIQEQTEPQPIKEAAKKVKPKKGE